MMPSDTLNLSPVLFCISISYIYLPGLIPVVSSSVKDTRTCPPVIEYIVALKSMCVADAYDFLMYEETENPVRFNGRPSDPLTVITAPKVDPVSM